jgi:hypothetical protein
MVFNYIYSLLAHGAQTGRAVDVKQTLANKYYQDIVDTLVPTRLSDTAKCLLAEFYIKMIKTDASLNYILWKIDPYNSYDIVDYDNIVDNDEFNITDIANNIKDLQLTTEQYVLPFDYIMNALEVLLKHCEVLRG